MITGAVMGNLDPLVQLLVRDAQGQDHPINFVVDTGFPVSLRCLQIELLRFLCRKLMSKRSHLLMAVEVCHCCTRR